VTDSLGPDAGDEVLRNVASRLGEIVRPGDTVARFGSHEFAVIVESPPSSPHDSGEAHVLADRIIAELAQPVKLADQQITLSVNVGIAFGGGNATADELSRNVVAANRDAKASGRNSYRVFEASMRAAALRRLQLTGDLRGGLDAEQFRLQYQPHVTMATGAVEGFEALVRWVHPRFGMIPPLDFIPLAEESGLIVPLGRWILEEACHRAASWPHPATAPVTVAVNLSVRQLRSRSMVDDVRAALAMSGLEPSRLVLEITESVLMADTTASISIFDELRTLGVRLSIDDFGTGYSSLSYLRRFNFDVLKVDKSFVDAMTERPEQGSAFIRTIVTLAHTLGMHVITEGIETADQFRELSRLGSDAGQGFLVARPLDPDAVVAFLDLPASDHLYVTPQRS
jgi:diguanylate cyclase (GGDEF)-like protein